MTRCAAPGCLNVVAHPAAVFCTVHNVPPQSRKGPYDYLGDESNRRANITEPEEKKRPEVEKCPVCHHISLLRLCYYHWNERGALDLIDTDRVTPPQATHKCDTWACFVCGARVRGERVHLLEQHDLKLEDYREDGHA